MVGLSRYWLPLALIGVLSGCGHFAPTNVVSPGSASEETRAALVAAEKLPASTLALVTAPDLLRAFDRLGREVIARRFRSEHEQLAFLAIAKAGIDVANPTELERIGVDLHGEAAVAWVEADLAAVVVTLADPARFKAEIYRSYARRPGGNEDAPEVVGDRVIIGAWGDAVVIDGRSALVLLGNRARDRAKALAETRADESLAARREFQRAMADIDASSDLSLYVDLRAICFTMAGLDRRERGMNREESLRELELEHRAALARARERRDSVDRIVALDDDYRRARDRIGNDSSLEEVRRVCGGIDGIALGIALRRDGFDLSGAAIVREASIWRRALKNTTPLPLRSALGDVPALFASAAFEPGLLAKEIGAGLGVAGAGPKKTDAVVDEVAGVVDGRIALAATLAEPRSDSIVPATDRLTLAAMVGISDVDGARRLLERFAERNVGLAKTSEGFTLSLPELRPIYLRIAGKLLIASQDPGLVTRAIKPEEARADPQVARTGKQRNPFVAIEPGDDAIDLAIDPGAAISMSFAQSWRERPAPLRITPPNASGEEQQAIQQELDAIEEQLAQLERQRLHHREVSAHGALRRLGLIALGLHETDSGFRIAGSYTTRGKHPMAAMAGARQALRKDGNDAVVRAIDEREFQLRRRSYELEDKAFELQSKQPESKQPESP